MSERAKGATSVSLEFRLADATTGAAKTGLDVTTVNLQYHRPRSAPSTATALTLLAAPTTAFTAFGAKEVDATNSPGLYRIDPPDAAFASGADEVAITVTGTAIQPVTRLIGLVTLDARAANPPTDWLNGNAVKADAVTKIQAGLGGDTSGTTTLLTRIPAAVALASQIPANFTTATFASAGVFSVGALANAPAGGGGGSDPWLTALPGSYGSGTAGSILGTTVPNIYSRLGAPAGASIAADIQTRSTYAGGDTSGTTTLLARVPAAAALAAQIPGNFTSALFASAGVFSTGALVNAPSGGGSNVFGKLIITGTVASVTNGGSFAVTFDSPGYDGNAAALTGDTLRLSFTSGLNHLQSELISGGTLTDATHASLLFSSAFTQTVAPGDTVAILSN